MCLMPKLGEESDEILDARIVALEHAIRDLRSAVKWLGKGGFAFPNVERAIGITEKGLARAYKARLMRQAEGSAL